MFSLLRVNAIINCVQQVLQLQLQLQLQRQLLLLQVHVPIVKEHKSVQHEHDKHSARLTDCMQLKRSEYLALFNFQQIKFNVLQLNRMIYAVRASAPLNHCTPLRLPLTIFAQIMPN